MSEVNGAAGPGDRSMLCVSHVADRQRRYPGEVVSFYSQVEVRQPLRRFELLVSVPPGLAVGGYRALNGSDEELPIVAVDGDTSYLVWSRESPEPFTGRFEYRVDATIAQIQEKRNLASQAVVTGEDGGGSVFRDVEQAIVVVEAKGHYLRYLPAIYQDDDLMGRLLMLFESFWAPIDGQIDNLSFYFDPRLTAPEFLPWLASWIDLVLDERWPEQKRRQLLSSAARLYRKRGTRQGLEEYVEIYTGERPQIVEHRAHNFRLGREARLGPSVALGTKNEPHTFTVTLRVPPESAASATEGGEAEGHRSQARQRWRRQIEAIIDSEKPAHTSYTLVIREV
jgi:phage tail-like protein